MVRKRGIDGLVVGECALAICVGRYCACLPFYDERTGRTELCLIPDCAIRSSFEGSDSRNGPSVDLALLISRCNSDKRIAVSFCCSCSWERDRALFSLRR